MLEIRKLGDPVLRRQAKPVRKINAGVRKLLKDMAETMYAANGAGLAAPQVGVLRRAIVADVGEGLIELINPEIVGSHGEETAVEGCLSVPDLVGEVSRAAAVVVSGLDRSGRRAWIEGTGMLSRVLQHEIDHLDGILFLDRASRVEVKASEPAEEKDG